MSEALVPRPHLDWYRKSAKKKLRDLRKKDASARLATAQLAVARQAGFSSWRKLRDAIAAKNVQASADALIESVRGGDLSRAKEILAVDRSLASSSGALMEAAEYNRPEFIDLLIDSGADTSALLGSSSHNALSWAVTVGAFDAAHALARRGMKPDLFCAAGMGLLKDVESFFDRRGKLIKNASHTGSSRFAKDGSRLSRPPKDPIEIVSDALYIAARNGRIEVARFLLAKGANPNFDAYMAATSLHWAYFNGSRELIDMLLQAGADPSAKDATFNATPKAFGIYTPASWGIEHLVRAHLTDDPSLANIREGRGTALHETARGGHLSILKLLIEAGADASATDTEGKTAAERAVESNHPEASAYLAGLKTSKKPSSRAKKSDWKPIMDAAYHGNPEKMRALLAAGADPNIISGTGQHWRPLHRVIEEKKTYPRGPAHEQVAAILLEVGADPNLRGGWEQLTALQLATIGETRFVPMLQSHFHPLDIWHASALGDERRVIELLKSNPKLANQRDVNEWRPLHYCAASALHRQSAAVAKALANLARRLIDAGADVNAARNFGGVWPLRALYDACGRSNNAAVAKILLQAGADACDNESTYHASDEMHQECLDLIEEFTDPKKLAQECTICLSTQMHWRRGRGMPWLMAHGANPNVLHAERGTNALHEAVMRSASDQVLKMLLDHGADPMVKTREGKTALALARKGRVRQTLERYKN